MELNSERMWEQLLWLHDKGGPVIVVIAGLSLLTLTFFIAKLLQMWRLGMFRLKGADAAVARWEQNGRDRARDMLASRRGCMAATLSVAMDALTRERASLALAEAEAGRVGRAYLEAARRGLRLLELVVTAAPLLGLLGTVLGMIEAFRRIELEDSRVDPSLLAGGIWEALLTTAAGMIVALIALAALSVLEAVSERARHFLEDRAARILNAHAADQAGSAENPAPGMRPAA